MPIRVLFWFGLFWFGLFSFGLFSFGLSRDQEDSSSNRLS